MFGKLKEENMQKIKEFEKELGYIQNPKIKNVVEIALCYVHPLFFQVEASSTGKYHPDYATGKRGLLRHTRAAVYMANALRAINPLGLVDYDLDIAIAALILHDTCKRGIHFDRPHTAHEHPLLVEYLVPTNTFFDEDKLIWDKINSAISSHMGQWTTSEYSTIVLPAPKTAIQNFVHQCDYLGSRKSIDVVGIWNDEDLKIIEEQRKLSKEKVPNEMLSEAQERYIKNLVAEYKDSCSKLGLDIPKQYLSESFGYLTKKAAGAFIGKLKAEVEKNKNNIAKIPC